MELFIWLRKNGITQKQLAKYLEVSQAHITAIAKGKVSPCLMIALVIHEVSKGEVPALSLLNPDQKEKFESLVREKKSLFQ